MYNNSIKFSMEKINNGELHRSSSYSWWWDSHNRSHRSQWLHATLAELDEKIKLILDVIEEDGDTFAKRAEMYYRKRPQLIKLVQELHRSYRALADKYDHDHHHRLLSKSQTSLQKPEIEEAFSLSETENSKDELKSSSNDLSSNKEDDVASYCYKENTNTNVVSWENVSAQYLQILKLADENLSELTTRNEEKMKIIDELKKENLILRSAQSTEGRSRKLKAKSVRSLKWKLKGCFCFQ